MTEATSAARESSLTRYEDTGKMGEALDYAAERAALSCGVRGGFGHPHPMNEN